jgi:hypothetical protein
LLSSANAAFSGEYDDAYVESYAFVFMEFTVESEFHAHVWLAYIWRSKLLAYPYVGFNLDLE